MIRASISPWHESVFRPYIKYSMRRHFNAIHLLGSVPDFEQRPMLLLPNHSTWWDGFFCYVLKWNLIPRPAYLMMLEEQLRKNKFFSHVGAFSIDPNSVKGQLYSLLYTVELLSLPTNPFVCLFPQGELLPWAVRPLGYKRGLELIFKRLRNPIILCQLGIKCEYLQGQYADVFFQFGSPQTIQPQETVSAQRLEKKHETLLDQMNHTISSGDTGQMLLEGKSPINESYEAFWERFRLGSKKNP